MLKRVSQTTEMTSISSTSPLKPLTNIAKQGDSLLVSIMWLFSFLGDSLRDLFCWLVGEMVVYVSRGLSGSENLPCRNPGLAYLCSTLIK